MKKTDLIKIFKHLNDIYQNKFPYPKETEAANKLMQNTWLMYLKSYDSSLVNLAVKRIVASNPEWPPTVGELLWEIRKLTRHKDDRLTAAEAWKLAREAALKYGHYQEKEGLLTLPVRVRETVKCIGRLETINRAEDDSYLMNTFMKVYKEFKARDEEIAVLPPDIQEEIQEVTSKFRALPRPEDEADKKAREQIEKKKQAEEKRVMEFYREHKELYEKN